MPAILGLLLGAAVVIYLACEFFVNGVEWVGHKLAVGQKATGTGVLSYPVSAKATGRYVLIWLSGNLPPDPDQPGQFQGRIYNVVVRGTASGNS